jgi:hypothetical protein
VQPPVSVSPFSTESRDLVNRKRLCRFCLPELNARRGNRVLGLVQLDIGVEALLHPAAGNLQYSGALLFGAGGNVGECVLAMQFDVRTGQCTGQRQPGSRHIQLVCCGEQLVPLQ